LAAGVGADGMATIVGSTDIRSVKGVYGLRWDGSTVTLFRGTTKDYSAAQNGAVNTTIPIMVLALNNNGAYANAAEFNMTGWQYINRAVTDSEWSKLVRAYS